MSDKPILFSASMVRALFDGRKTQTRRVAKFVEAIDDGEFHIHSAGGGLYGISENDVPNDAVDYAPYQIGDRLWIREAYRINGWATDVATVFYRAHENASYSEMCEQWPVADHKPIAVTPGKWRPGIHLPRWASRMTLVVTDVRVQRLQEITEEDAIAEGAQCEFRTVHGLASKSESHQFGFANVWDAINGAGAWAANPFVVAYTFSVHHCNIDKFNNGDNQMRQASK